MSEQIHAGTEVPHPIEHAEPSALGLTPPAWVAVSMMVVIALLVWKKVPGTIAGMLDKKIATIRKTLAEAAQLRAEAEAIRAEYEKRAAEAASEAEALLANAREEAGLILNQARSDAEALIVRRAKMAQDKIAAAERTAVAEVRAKAASAATAAAAALIAQGHDASADQALVDRTIAGLGGARLN